ncbi:MAG: 2OG-Fe(II) oxygenase [Hyphomicrobiales bacterium]|nr:2OG-Fe(II) oxygenase [Hyphomicrobiales bacterium]
MMRSEWAYYESFLDAAACQEIVDAALKYPIEKGTVTSDSKLKKEVRHSDVIFLQRTDPVFSNVFATLDYCVDQANDEWFGVDYNRFGTRAVQFTIYRGAEAGEKGQHYNMHQDSTLISGEHPSQRKLSVTVQLSDDADYEGGDFTMHYVTRHPPADAIRKRGTILVFPSLVHHSVTPVSRGVRYSLVAWYVGRPWR